MEVKLNSVKFTHNLNRDLSVSPPLALNYCAYEPWSRASKRVWVYR